MIRTLDWKLVYRPDEVSELYDLQADPRELHNVYALPEQVCVRDALERRLLDWLVQTSDVVPWDEDPRGLPA